MTIRNLSEALYATFWNCRATKTLDLFTALAKRALDEMERDGGPWAISDMWRR